MKCLKCNKNTHKPTKSHTDKTFLKYKINVKNTGSLKSYFET